MYQVGNQPRFLKMSTKILTSTRWDGKQTGGGQLQTGHWLEGTGDWEGVVWFDASNQKTYVKPEAAITVFELLLMSGVPFETR